jgi:hypothetical protein
MRQSTVLRGTTSGPDRIPRDDTFLVWPLLATNIPYLDGGNAHGGLGGSVLGILSVYISTEGVRFAKPTEVSRLWVHHSML